MRKHYLKTPEEVLETLKEGKRIIDGGGNISKLKDGFIITKYQNGDWALGTTIDNCDEVYFEEKEPLKLEVGKFYKTRDGRKAYCFYKDEYYDRYKIVLLGFYETYYVSDTGKKDHQTDNLDLIAEWKED